MSRKPPLSLVLSILVGVATLASAQGDGGSDMLAENGQSPYVIVVAEGASPSEEQAAQALQRGLEACTKAQLPVLGESELDTAAGDGDARYLLLGAGPLANKLGFTFDCEAWGEQGYTLQTAAPHIAIAGTPGAGTLYGVYDFLERVLGMRWYAPGATKTPHHESLALPNLDDTVRPAFAWRHTSYARPGRDAAYLARQRDNNGGGGAEHPWGLQYSFDSRAHSYFRYVSPGEFWETHPEYFSEIGGVRRHYETQLCLTNPDMLDLVTERMLARMEASPNHRQYNFSQKDYYNYCECATCSAMNAKYGSLGGTQFWFVNELAKRTTKVYPDKLIGTLAYMYTEEPPKGMEMHPNVAVWLCHMFPSCDSHPIATCPVDADYKRRAEAWSELCGHLYIWHYIVDFAHYYNPFPNFRAMAADMRFYHDIGVEGIYLQGMGAGGGGGEFSLLRPYYGMKLLWNPNVDADALIRDFLEGYYGPAWKAIHEYITMLHDKVENENIHMHLYTNSAQGYLPDEVLERACALFDQAEAAVADDAELLERVKVARLPLTYAYWFPRNGGTLKDNVLRFNPPMAALPEMSQMYQRMKKHGFASVREMYGDLDQLMAFSLMLNAPIPAPKIENAHLAVNVVPLLGGRALTITDKATGKCITAHNVTKGLPFPFNGGEETRLAGVFRPKGLFEQFGVVEQGKGSIVIETACDGFTLRRSLSLDADSPILRIRADATNPGDKPRETTVRSHMELDLGELRQTRVRFSNRNGEQVERDMGPIIAGLREGEYYRLGNAPKGEWIFTGSKGLEVTQRFDDEALDFAWLYAYPEDLGELEVEVWGKRTRVAPGETLSFSHSLEVRPMPGK